MAETSMMALNRYRLRHLVKTGNRGARLTAQLLSRTDRLLGVVLLGNNLVNALSAALVTYLTFRLFGESEVTLLIGTICVTFAILVFSEITPKVIGATYPERIALPAAYVLTPLLWLAYPIVWFVNLFVGALLRLFRLKSAPDAQGQKLTLEELRTLVLEGGNFLPQKHQNMLVNLFDLESVTVDDIMVPRSQIDAVDIESPPETLRHQIGTSNHTRIPVYQGTLEEIIGILHVRKFLNIAEADEITPERLRQILREPYFVPQGTPLLTQLQHFQEQQDRLGLVVDEYGELLGMVTLEDILEEIIGEFTTQSPLSITGSFRRQPDGSIMVEGGSLLRDLNRKLGTHFPLGGPKTLNGLILEHFEDIPEAGTSMKLAGHPLEIVQIQDRVVKSVRLLPLESD
ncbi:MAG: HlyC/CorC family transporter [Burkholderiales bacterium]|nr:HlyC/CorC family transporter [Burkholderiales bacterium]